jgi:hypothetical protein
MDKKFIYSLSFILIIISLSAGFFIGRTNGYEAGFNDGEKVTEAKYVAGYLPLAEPEEINSFFGTITDITDGVITMEASLVTYLPREDPKTETKRITVTGETKFLRQFEGALEEWRRLQEEYFTEIEMGLDPVPPQPFETETIEFADLAVGDKISVGAGENIKDKDEFEASFVILIR